MKKRSLFVAALLFAGFPLLAAEPKESKAEVSSTQLPRLKVGDVAVTGLHLKPYTDLWNFTIQKPGAEVKPAGTWSDALEVVDFHGKPAMKRTQVAKYDKGIQLTFVNIFDPATMEPFSFDYSRSDNGSVRHVDFQNSTATYRHTDGKDAKPAEATANLGQSVFDFYGGMYGVLISTLPLRDDYAAEIPTLDTNKMAVDWVPVRVKGRETVDAGAGRKAETWVVETPTKFYGKMTWWVTKEPPYVIKAQLEVLDKEDGSGKTAAVVTYTMA